MKLYQLIHVLSPNMAITVCYDDNAVRYHTVDELMQDFIFYDEIRERTIVEIWESKALYNSIVINLI